MNKNEIHYGIVKFYNVGRNYGFIIERGTTKEYFVCMTSLIDHVKAGSEVCFKLKDDPKGMMAIEVKLINNETLKIRNNGSSNRTE
jgi:CspA family cold shock protein